MLCVMTKPHSVMTKTLHREWEMLKAILPVLPLLVPALPPGTGSRDIADRTNVPGSEFYRACLSGRCLSLRPAKQGFLFWFWVLAPKAQLLKDLTCLNCQLFSTLRSSCQNWGSIGKAHIRMRETDPDLLEHKADYGDDLLRGAFGLRKNEREAMLHTQGDKEKQQPLLIHHLVASCLWPHSTLMTSTDKSKKRKTATTMGKILPGSQRSWGTSFSKLQCAGLLQ